MNPSMTTIAYWRFVRRGHEVSRDREDPKLYGLMRKNKTQGTSSQGSRARNNSNCDLLREIYAFAWLYRRRAPCKVGEEVAQYMRTTYFPEFTGRWAILIKMYFL